MNRVRIREIAEEVAHSDTIMSDYAGIASTIESAILRFAEELLTGEPSQAVIRAGEKERLLGYMTSTIYRAMSAQLLKELKDG